MKTRKLWKSLKTGMQSEHGSIKWELQKWYKHTGDINICHAGYHASENIVDAIQYVTPDIIALVEVRGENQTQEDKECWSEMRIIRTWEFTKKLSVQIAIYSAELVIDIFEKKYPDDKRPRDAIKSEKKWIKNPSESAYASAAASAAYAAAYAYASAYASAYSYANAYAYASAARKEIINKIHKYIKKLLGVK